MTTVKGEVKVKSFKEITTKRGPGTLHSLLVDDESQGEVWVGFGFSEPQGVSKGDLVEIETHKDQYGVKAKPEDVKVTGKAPPPQPASGNSSSSNSSNSRDDYWARREERDYINDAVITLAGARNSAISMVNMLVSNSLLALPKTDRKRQEFAEGLVEYYQKKFLDETQAARTKVIKGEDAVDMEDTAIISEDDNVTDEFEED